MRTHHHSEFPLHDTVLTKGSHRIAVIVPARDEAATIGRVVGSVPSPLVDDVVVVDDGSADATAAEAAAAGARVVRIPPQGKGAAMAAGLAATDHDIVVFLDADVRNLQDHFVAGLAGPLLAQAGLQMVKAFYERPIEGDPRGGGRVTELVARPLLAQLFPHLAAVRQPLAGEVALRRTALEGLQLAQDYGVDLALLLDVVDRAGVDALAQVDLGVRVHRNRPLVELVPMAEAVLRVALERAGTTPRA